MANLASGFAQDVSYALRQMRRNIGFTLVAVLTLALGIGANTAMFSVINGVLLQPLPYRDPGRVVLLSERTQRFPILSVSWQNYVDWRDQSKSFEAMGAVRNAAMTLTGGSEPERLTGQMATSSVFDLLGVSPVLGRTFTAEEDRAGGPAVVLISNGLWQRRFGSSSQVIGQTLTLDNRIYTVIGVMPPKFEIMQQTPDVIVPMGPWAAGLPNDRSWHPGILPIARLKEGVTLDQARAEMSTIAKRLLQQYAESNIATDANVNVMQDQLVQNVRSALLMLLGAVSFVLLIACANVANLLLSRATARKREMAVRTAMGASRWRIVRQLLTESVMLSVAGGVLGLVLAVIGLRVLLQLGSTSVPGIAKVHVDAWVLAFTTLLAVGAGILFGIAPALHTGNIDLRSSLNEMDRAGVSRGSARLRGALVIGEVAVAMLLLVGAGLLLRSFDRLSRVDPGFATDHILIADLPVSPTTYAKPADRMAFFDSVLERTSALPGVRAAGATSFLPVSGAGALLHFNIQGRPPKSPDEYVMANYRTVSAGYLKAIGMPLVQGRWLTDADREGAPMVVVINQSMAKTFFPNQSPIGQHMQVGTAPDPEVPWMEIVGVVGDVKQALANDAPTEMYVAYRQANQVLPVNTLSLVVRSTTDPTLLTTSLRNVVREVNPNQPVINVRTMEQNIANNVAAPRFRTTLLATFAVLALIIASVGIYGVMAYSVTQRTREIGVRIALGSTPSRIFRLVVGDGMRLALIGVAVGIALSLVLTRYLASLLFQVKATDPATMALVGLLLASVALVACYVPARRATRVQVSDVLRQE